MPVGASPYGLLDRIIHRIAFLPAVQRMGEQAQERAHGALISRQQIKAPIIISGLPRAGSTILLQRLHATEGVVSPLYRDMPFVTAPLWWDGLTGRNRQAAPRQERAHGDGVLTGADSPEAFDEVLWLRHWPEHYSAGRITPWGEGEDKSAFAADWLHWMKAVLALHGGDGPARLVLKNNAHIARLRLVARLLPDAVILVPYREPGQQAASLLNQHRKATEHQQQVPFARRYMDDLGHFEFGTGHRPIAFPGFAPEVDAASVGYWLDCWRASYDHVLGTMPENAWLLDYDKACTDEAAMDAALARIAGLAGERSGAPALKAAKPRDAHADTASLAVYDRLRAHPRNLV
jgi:hypothetical protein